MKNFEAHVLSRLDYLIIAVHRILKMEGNEMAALDDLTAQVSATVGAQASAIVAINGLADKVDALIAAGNSDPALVQLAADLRASTDTLSAAVAENPIPA